MRFRYSPALWSRERRIGAFLPIERTAQTRWRSEKADPSMDATHRFPRMRRSLGQGSRTAGAYRRPRSLLVLAALATAGAGSLCGFIVGRLNANVASTMQGACLALDMATAYGALDDPTRRRVERALGQVNHPYSERFPGGYRTLHAVCVDLAAQRWAER
jgi:hypothetical protein